MSNFLSLNSKDLLKGLLVAFLTAFLTGLYTAIDAGTISMTWVFFKPLVLSGTGAGIAYILKNWLQNSNGQILKVEDKSQV